MKKTIRIFGIGAAALLVLMILIPACSADPPETSTVTGTIDSYELNRVGLVSSFIVNDVTINIDPQSFRTVEEWQRFTDRIIHIFDTQDQVKVWYLDDGNIYVKLRVMKKAHTNGGSMEPLSEGGLI